MHCLGCPASAAETLEEACAVHGIDVDEVLKELNAVESAQLKNKRLLTICSFDEVDRRFSKKLLDMRCM